MRYVIWAFAPLLCAGLLAQETAPPAPPLVPMQPMHPGPAPMAAARAMIRDSEDGAYRSGTQAIDRREYERAIAVFGRVIERKGSRADGALYWKAYALNKMGRRDQSLAALSELQRDFGQSRWLSDAKALEVEVRQASGQPVSPDAEGDEDIKLLAINGLMESDPERALPLLQNVLGSPKASPRVKERALFVVAQSRDQRGKEILAHVAQGAGNPDMQLKAVEYLGMFSKGNTQLLANVYAGSNDPAVKRAVLRGLMMAGDSERLLSLAKSEKTPELRREAIRTLGMLKRDRTGDALVSLYGSESDRAVKQAIVEGLFMQQNAKALIDIARKEPDLQLKKDVVQRLAMMRSKEATDFMMEVINK